MQIRIGNMINLEQNGVTTPCKVADIQEWGIFLHSEKPVRCAIETEQVELNRFWQRGTTVLIEPATMLRSALYEFTDTPKSA